jgi:TonB family protein
MKNKKPALLVMSCLLGTVVRALADEPSGETQRAEEVVIDAVEPPKISRLPTKELYPLNDIKDGREGWVIMTIMVDSNARPVGAMINDSSGNPAFERSALKAVDTMTFKPAMRNGKPVEGSIRFKIKFAIDNLAKGASPGFVSVYRQFMKAIEARDKPKADEQLGRLEAKNLYEEAFANFAKYYYHAAWGTQNQQREDLTDAIAGEKQPNYLPKALFVSALYLKFKLEIASSEFGSALDTWDVLEPLADADMHRNVQKLVDAIHAIQAGGQPTRIEAVIGDQGRWSTWLLLNRFHVVVKNGSISDVNLNCARKYRTFKFDPDMQYSIGSAKDRCEVVLQGEPGTSFEFNQ